MSEPFISPSFKSGKHRLSLHGVEEHAPNYWEDLFNVNSCEISSTKSKRDKGILVHMIDSPVLSTYYLICFYLIYIQNFVEGSVYTVYVIRVTVKSGAKWAIEKRYAMN